MTVNRIILNALVLAILAFLPVSHICAQTLTQTLRGKVYDQQSNHPVIGATVIISGSDPMKGAATDANGNFKIEQVSVGRHTLIISSIGYTSRTIPEILVGSGKEVIMDISLEESLIKLDEVVIDDSNQQKGAPRNDMATISAQSFSVEETGRYAATFDDPARAALIFPGVHGGGDDILNEIVVRGNSSRSLLWRIEGVEVPNPNHFGEIGSSAGGISMLSNNMLTTSDFYTSAFPAEYGNAIAGVFDIHLRNGNNEKREYAIETGIIGLQTAFEGPLTKAQTGSYLVNLRLSTLSVLGDLGIIPTGQQDTRFNDLSFKFHLPTQKLGAFSFWGLGGLSKQTIAADANIQEYFNENFTTKMAAGGLKHVLFLDENTFLETSLAITGSNNLWNFDSLAVRTIETEDFRNQSLVASVMANRKFNARHTVRLGSSQTWMKYDYFSQWFDDQQGQFITDINDGGHLTRFQAFAQWQYRPGERIVVNSGVHYNRLNLNGDDNIEPRLGIKWKLDEGQHVNLGVGLHSRIETPVIYLSQTDLNDDGQYVQANRNLRMAKAVHYVVGYEKYFSPNLRAKVEAYYQDLYDLVVIHEDHVEEPWQNSFSAINTTGGYTSIPLSNDGGGYNYGLEFTLEKFFTDSYYFIMTGSLYESKYWGVDLVTRNTRFNGNYVANLLSGKEFSVGREKNNLLGINMKFILAGNNRYTPIDLAASIVDGSPVMHWDRRYESRLSEYWRVDLGFKYQRNKSRHSSIWSLNAQNVTNRLNQGGVYYSEASQSIQTWEQLGILPNLSYRVEF